MEGMQDFYQGYEEDTRLTKDRAHTVEAATTIASLAAHIKPGMRLLDIGCGAGHYSIHYADAGCQVTSMDPVPRHIDTLAARRTDIPGHVGDARDLSQFADQSFDAILCLGPIYHLATENEKKQALAECCRVLRPGGILAVAWINRHAALAMDFMQKTNIPMEDMRSLLAEGITEGSSFSRDTPEGMQHYLQDLPLEQVDMLGTDGITLLLKPQVNAMSEQGFDTFMTYHMRSCRDPAILGYSLHGLMILRKKEPSGT